MPPFEIMPWVRVKSIINLLKIVGKPQKYAKNSNFKDIYSFLRYAFLHIIESSLITLVLVNRIASTIMSFWNFAMTKSKNCYIIIKSLWGDLNICHKCKILFILYKSNLRFSFLLRWPFISSWSTESRTFENRNFTSQVLARIENFLREPHN